VWRFESSPGRPLSPISKLPRKIHLRFFHIPDLSYVLSFCLPFRRIVLEMGLENAARFLGFLGMLPHAESQAGTAQIRGMRYLVAIGRTVGLLNVNDGRGNRSKSSFICAAYFTLTRQHSDQNALPPNPP